MPYCERTNCGYYYQAEGEKYARCHCPDDGFPAPCEENDYYKEEEDNEIRY